MAVLCRRAYARTQNQSAAPEQVQGTSDLHARRSIPTASTDTKPRRGIKRSRRPGILVALSTVLMVASIAVTYALWSTHVTDGAIVTAGNLSMTLGDLRWECTQQKESGTASTLPDFYLAPGNTLTIRQDITTSLVGDNLSVALSVEFSTLPDYVSGTWYVRQDGIQFLPKKGSVPISQALVIPHEMYSAESHWEIVIDLVVSPHGSHWVDPTTTSSAPPLKLGTLTVIAQQERCGDGFMGPCLTGGTP
ncbi:MAG: hypothetical protein FWD55_03060 [Propionibacteriaceae bacterium]|nr:hypothetical protein [Propionibacteriaceae bacterium]